MVHALSVRTHRTGKPKGTQRSGVSSNRIGRIMTLRIVSLGEPRHPAEGTRIGTVRHPPRGVRKDRYAADNWFDVWYPDLAPSAGLVAQGRGAVTENDWKGF